jgi:hypothetical protein
MWCSTCQQDVPGLGSPGSAGELRCGKCGANLVPSEPSKPATRMSADTVSAKAATFGDNAALKELLQCPPLPEDDWTLEAELRGVQRLLSSLKSRQPEAGESATFHLSQAALPGWHALSAAEPDLAEESPDSSSQQPRSNRAAWTILSLSLAVFACGAVLLAWSLLGQREDLWPIGLPLALIGQAGMIMGLVLQIDGLSGRRIAENRSPPRRRRPHRPALSPGDAHLP